MDKSIWKFRIGKSDFKGERKWAVGYSETLRVFFDDIIINHLNISPGGIIEIKKDEYCIAKAPSGFMLRKRFGEEMQNSIASIKENLKNGMSLKELKKSVTKGALLLSKSENKYGEFLEVRYPYIYANSIADAIKIYPGNSMKQATDEISFADMLEGFEKRLVVKSFVSKLDSKDYYRIYLRKEKNIISTALSN